MKYSLEKITAWSYGMEGHAEKCVERYCALARKDVSSLQQVATPCIDDHLVPPEDHETTRELSALCPWSTELNEEQEECARQYRKQASQGALQNNGQYRDVHKANVFRSYVPTKATNTTTGLVIHSKEKVYMSDSGASLHMTGLSSLTKIKRTTPFDNHSQLGTFRPPRELWPQAPKQNYTLRSLRFSWVHLVDDSPLVLSFGKRPSREDDDIFCGFGVS